VVTVDGLREYLIWDTVYNKHTLLDEVMPFGFQMHGIYDDVCGSPYTGKAETLCLVLKKVKINYNSWKNQLGELQSSVDYELTKDEYLLKHRTNGMLKL